MTILDSGPAEHVNAEGSASLAPSLSSDPGISTKEQPHLLVAELASLLECSICNELMHSPASLLCGHSFCVTCLRSSLDRSRACPLCRQPCHTVNAVRTNIALASIAAAAFPAEVAERRFAHSVGMEKSSRKILPVLLSTHVEFPGALCVLPHPRM